MMRRIDLILHEISSKDAVLDIGCVDHTIRASEIDTWLHKYLYEKAEYVLGIDIIKSEVEKLRDKGFNVKVADAENFTVNRQFDVIIAGELIEHLANPGKFLEKCREHLKKDGKLILTTPNVWFFWRIFNLFRRDYVISNVEHTCWYDKKTLSQLLTRYRFQIINFIFMKAYTPKLGILSSLLFKLKLKQLGGETLFVVCRKR